MIELDKCFELRKQINDIERDISELKGSSFSPKTQILMFAPTFGGDNANMFDNYLIKLEQLEYEKSELEQEINNTWNVALERLKLIDINSMYINLIRLRFYYALEWKECYEVMKRHYSGEKWYESKIYKMYKNILEKV